MVTLASLVADVFTLTNRPDLVGETKIAVKNAILKAHGSDYYYKDLIETGIEIDYPANQTAIEYKTLIPRWRALKYLRKYDINNYGQGAMVNGQIDGYAGKFLEVLSPDSVLDNYSINRPDVCYVAGAELQIRSTTAQRYYLLGCYVFPDITEDRFSSWVAEEQPGAIVYEAAHVVFKTIGFDEQAQVYRQLASDEYGLLRLTNIQAVGY